MYFHYTILEYSLVAKYSATTSSNTLFLESPCTSFCQDVFLYIQGPETPSLVWTHTGTEGRTYRWRRGRGQRPHVLRQESR